MSKPVLYSFRRCPYAIRARMAIRYAGVSVELREVELKNKPVEMLELSAKGTVPVLVDTNGNVIDESLDIMHWALCQSDPDNWLSSEITANANALIKKNDDEFKGWLDKYKYHVGHPEHPPEYYRTQCEVFFSTLEALLEKHSFLLSEKASIADIAIFPFVRQCAFVDKAWFDQTPYPHLKNWLNHFLSSELFLSVMKKHDPWLKNQNQVVIF